ncbi:PulJ/GspJ family protein [Geodermatophilus sp. SYSU D01036]
MLRTRRDAEAGFTLVELLMAIVILGIVAVPLANVVIGYFKTTGVTAARMNESHDAQIAAAYFAQDVQAVGVRDYVAFGTREDPFALKRSVQTNVAATGGDFPCGVAETPDAVLRLAWDVFPSAGAATPAGQTRVSYVVEGTELHRIVCTTSATPASDTVVAHNLVDPATAAALGVDQWDLSCADPAGTPLASCEGAGSAVPSTITLTFTVRDPNSRPGTTYAVTLTGHRRQS